MKKVHRSALFLRSFGIMLRFDARFYLPHVRVYSKIEKTPSTIMMQRTIQIMRMIFFFLLNILMLRSELCGHILSVSIL